MALVHAVEALKHPVLLIFGNTDTCVADRQQSALGGSFGSYRNAAATPVVFDCIVAKIVNNAAEKLRYAVDSYGGAAKLDAYTCAARGVLKTLDNRLGDLMQIGIGALHIHRALVQAGKSDNILNQRHKPL